MNYTNIINEKTRTLISDLFRRFDIRSMSVNKGSGITKQSEISDINLMFIKDEKDESLDYSVKFKLQHECADIWQFLKAITAEPEFSIELTQQSEKLDGKIVNDKLKSLIDIIRDRVKSAQKEQSVQNISYVGNTFILNNSTKFKVLSDEGEGRLNIEVITEGTHLDAKLTASGLLDGLYLGSIKLLDS